ncbi:hypothetical protein JCM16303_000020 [Sporobolomyces ruberrimus]
MGFCRRCGEIVSGDRCRCGGTSRESTTKILFGERAGDKWSQRYLARSSSPTSQSVSTTQHTAPTASVPSAPPAPTPFAPPARPPPSPSKLAHSFLRQSESEDAELSCVFGSVLSPKDHWQCSSCQVKFRQEEVIYPHPDAKTDPSKLGDLYYCRQCFAERFSLGNCKKCKLAVLSDAKFIKHENNLWHEPCYVCSYCSNLTRTSIVIDFAARPSCEDCFDSFAYKSAGILPSPHLSQSEWNKLPVEAPPAPNKWGRPSLVGSTSVWSSKPAVKRDVIKASVGGATAAKGNAWRIRQERDDSPLVETYDELGDKLKKLGLTGVSSPTTAVSKVEPTSHASRPLSQAPLSCGSRPASPEKLGLPASNVQSVSSAPSFASTASASPPPRRAALQPLQPETNLTSRPDLGPVPAVDRNSASPSRAASPSKKGWGLPPSSSSSRSITPLSTDGPAALTKLPSPINDQETCPACSRSLGYGQFVELPSGTVLHLECFVCQGCRKSISGKYVEAETKAYHQECSPRPKRFRTVITSLADPAPTSSGSSPSPTSPETPNPLPLTEELLSDEDPVCAACGGLLGYGLTITVPKSGKSFHSKCFTCATCSKAFEKGFVENGGLAYHEHCAPILPKESPLARVASPSSPSRTSRPPRLPSLPSYPPKHTSTDPLSPSSLPPRSLFSTRQRPPSNLGGLLICTGCSVRATEKETVPGPGGRRYHRKCLVCCGCKREVDSECRGGETGILRCEACRKLEARRSYKTTTSGPTPALSSR